MSHHGTRGPKARDGSLPAYLAAYALGYRWFQVDVVPYRDGLVCMHAVFGRRRGFAHLSLAELQAKVGYEVPDLRSVLGHADMPFARWNIEIKNGSGLALRHLINAVHHDGAVRPVLVSAPFHPKVLRELDDRFGDLVALAAPLRHGGAVGIRIGPPREPYTSVQVHRWVAPLVARTRWGRTLAVQTWGLGTVEQVDRALDVPTHPIVSDTTEELRDHLIARGRWPRPLAEVESAQQQAPRTQAAPVGAAPPATSRRAPVALRPPDDASVPIGALCLGGGGWRGAFGSIGTVMYLHTTGRWADVRTVIAVSGGSFLTARLAGAGAAAQDDPTEVVARLLPELLARRGSLRRRLAAAALPAPLVVVPPVFAFVERQWLQRLMRGLLDGLFADERAVATGDRRYVVCATGRASARSHYFIGGPPPPERPSDTVGFRRRRLPAVRINAPWKLADAVQAATSLPGIDGYRAPNRPPVRGDERRGEILIDGGVQGIFGRQFFLPDHDLWSGDSERTLILDAGREERRSSPLMERITTLSTIALLARWVQLALDAGFRDQVRQTRVYPDLADGPAFRWTHLVRIAERDTEDPEPYGYPWAEVIRRIECGRRKVHRFGLTGLSAGNAHLTMAVAIAACAFELGDEQRKTATVASIDGLLLRIGDLLGLGDALAEVWRDL